MRFILAGCCFFAGSVFAVGEMEDWSVTLSPFFYKHKPISDNKLRVGVSLTHRLMPWLYLDAGGENVTRLSARYIALKAQGVAGTITSLRPYASLGVVSYIPIMPLDLLEVVESDRVREWIPPAAMDAVDIDRLRESQRVVAPMAGLGAEYLINDQVFVRVDVKFLSDVGTYNFRTMHGYFGFGVRF